MAEKTIQQLEAENASLLKRLEKANASTKTARGQVKDLSEQLQVAEATKGSKLPTVKVDGEPYIFTTPRAKVGKVIMTADDAAKDTDLCKQLVKKGSGWLKSVTIKKAEADNSNETE